MPRENPDLHGNAPDKSPVALILIDVINDLEFPEGDQLLHFAVPMADRIAELKRTCEASRRSRDLRERQLRPLAVGLQRTGRTLPARRGARPPDRRKLLPGDDDYFVLKPKHSGFFSTTLDLLLDTFRFTTVILTGIAANICVLFTANDAYMRDYRLYVPRDCVS